jgi:hypothetical protein
VNDIGDFKDMVSAMVDAQDRRATTSVGTTAIVPGGTPPRDCKPRREFLELAQKCGARLTGKPNGSEPIEVVFRIAAWQEFDRANIPAPSVKTPEADGLPARWEDRSWSHEAPADLCPDDHVPQLLAEITEWRKLGSALIAPPCAVSEDRSQLIAELEWAADNGYPGAAKVAKALTPDRVIEALPAAATKRLITAFELELSNDPEAYTRPGEVVYQVTQKELLAFASKLTNTIAGQDAPPTPLDERYRSTEQACSSCGLTMGESWLLHDIKRGAAQARLATSTAKDAGTVDQAGFEKWALSHGGLALDKAGDALKTDDGLHFPTYKFGRTEIAWRAWANRKFADATIAPQGAVRHDARDALLEEVQTACEELMTGPNEEGAAACVRLIKTMRTADIQPPSAATEAKQ